MRLIDETDAMLLASSNGRRNSAYYLWKGWALVTAPIWVPLFVGAAVVERRL